MTRTVAILLCLLVSVFGFQTASAEWTSVDIGSVGAINGASYAQANSIWTCDSNGSVWMSNDAGQTWTEHTEFNGAPLSGISFADDMFGSISSEWGQVFATTDGGATWTTEFDAWLSFYDVYTMPGTEVSLAVGQNTIMQPFGVWTDDAWTTDSAWNFYWTIDNVGTEGGIRGITALSTDVFIAAGTTWMGDGAIAVTTNGGSSWTTSWVSYGVGIWDVVSSQNGTLIAVTDAGNILRSTDDGTSWDTVYNGVGFSLRGAAAASDDVFYAVGTNGTIVKSEDGGLNWDLEDGGTVSTLLDVSFFDETAGIAVGEGGTAVMYSGGATDPVTLTLTPANTTIPETGGTLTYDVHLQSFIGDSYNNVMYWTDVVLPNGNTYGPIVTQSFNLAPYMDHTATGLTQNVPGTAPAGSYTFQGHVGYMNGPSIMDSFEFTKDAALANGGGFDANGWTATGDLMAVEESVARTAVPSDYAVSAVAPNPFNPTAQVSVALPEASDLTVTVYNTMGQQVANLAQGSYPAGTHALTLDGSAWASGLYFVHVQVAGQLNSIQKVTLMK